MRFSIARPLPVPTAAILLCLLVGVQGDLICDSGWSLYFRGETCARVFTFKETWQDARTSCSRYGAELIRVEDAQKQDFLNGIREGQYQSLWLGLRRTKAAALTFSWLDEETAISYKAWIPGMPDNKDPGQDCVATSVASAQWVNIECSRMHGMVCEKPAVHKAPKPCPHLWTPYGHHCYRVHKDRKSWHDAKAHCASVQSDLATIPNQKTADFIYQDLANIDMWIGLNDVASKNNFVWGDGAKLNTNYTNWARGQTPGPDQDCVYLSNRGTRKWTRQSCTATYPSLCQRSVINENIKCLAGWDLHIATKTCLMTLDIQLDWRSANTQCQTLGAHLARISDDVMNKYVLGRIKGFPIPFWIDLHKNKNSDKFTWSKKVKSVTYNRADNSTWRHDTEYCGTISRHNTTWGKDDCKALNGLMCQRPAFGAVECPKGYKIEDSIASCLRVSREPLDWKSAREACQKDGGNLVTLLDSYINNIISGMVKSSHQSVWIGLYDNHNRFQWADDTESYKPDKLPFNNWAVGRPSNRSDTLNCVYLSGPDGRWHDDRCGKKRQYVCQTEATITGSHQESTDTQKRICPDGWEQTGATCLNYYTTKQTWSGARQQCQKKGGDLVTIDNNDLDSFINALLISRNAKIDAYIGLNDIAKRGRYVWLDQQKKATYASWRSGSPIGLGHSCAVIKVGVDYNMGWKDINCRYANGYICQQESLLPENVNCGQGWEDSPESDYCFRFNPDTLSWREARAYCLQHGGDLVSVESPEEMLYLDGRLRAEGGAAGGGSFWTGGNDLSLTAGWQWTDGKPFGFFNWDVAEPKKNGSLNCVSKDQASGRWRVRSCVEHMASICKKLGNEINHPPPLSTTPPTKVPADKVWACPQGWYSFRGSCYLVVHFQDGGGATWQGAKDGCLAKDAGLAAITDQKENDFVLSIIYTGYQKAWIGLTDSNRRLSFAWSDGHTPLTYTNWMAGQPEVRDKSCIAIREDSGKWASNNCEDVNAYAVCKANKRLIKKSNFDPYKGCPQGGKGYYDRCFLLSSDTLTFDDAQDYCNTHLGGNLATVTDRNTQAYLASEMEAGGEDYWLGLSNRERTKSVYGTDVYVYTWKSGQAFDYTHWDRYHTGSEISTCVALHKPFGFWHNQPCHTALRYVCEYSRPGYSTPTPPSTQSMPLLLCPTGWIAVGHMCYKAFGNSKESWMAARSICESAVTMGGTLASITGEGLGKALERHALRTGRAYWIGLNNRDVEGGYRWAGGETFDYQNWAPGEPNNHKNMENCVQWELKGWNDFNCYGAFPFLCQAPRGTQLVTTLSPPTVGPTDTQCGTGRAWYLYQGYCYYLSRVRQVTLTSSWQEARRQCRSLGAQMASIGDAKENGYLTSLISHNSITAAWIGLTNLDDDVYKWVDKTPLSFLSWDSNEPNDADGGERCATLKSNGLWNDARCSISNVYLCKKRPGDHNPVTLPPTPSTSRLGCPAHFHGSPGTSKCYRVGGIAEEDRKSFLSANTACGEFMEHSRLASIHSDIDQDSKVPVWLGMRSVQESLSLHYVWLDNTENNYVHWGRSQPQGHGWDSPECSTLMVKPEVAGDWATTNCQYKLPYLCQAIKSSAYRTSPPDATDCPKGYVRYRQACYKYNHNPLDWAGSQNTCARDGADLVSQQGDFDKSFVELLRHDSQGSWVWIGLSDIEAPGTFRWSSEWPVVYTAWDLSQPDFNHRCVAQGDGAKWATKDCSMKMASICQIYLTDPPVTHPVPGKCPSSLWTHLGEACYFLEAQNKLTWPGAAHQCQVLGGWLVSVHSANESMTVTSLLQQQMADSWLGLSRSDMESSFAWNDESQVEYFNWAPGSPLTPGLTSTTTNRNCVLAQGNDGKWTDSDCFQKQNFLCQSKQVPFSTTPTTSTASTTTTATTTNPTTTITTTRTATPNPTTTTTTTSPTTTTTTTSPTTTTATTSPTTTTATTSPTTTTATTSPTTTTATASPTTTTATTSPTTTTTTTSPTTTTATTSPTTTTTTTSPTTTTATTSPTTTTATTSPTTTTATTSPTTTTATTSPTTTTATTSPTTTTATTSPTTTTATTKATKTTPTPTTSRITSSTTPTGEPTSKASQGGTHLPPKPGQSKHKSVQQSSGLSSSDIAGIVVGVLSVVVIVAASLFLLHTKRRRRNAATGFDNVTYDGHRDGFELLTPMEDSTY